MMKKAFFLPLLLIVCLLAPVPAVHSISLAGNALKVIPPIPDFSASNPVPFGRPDDDFESLYDDASVITPAFKRVQEIYEKGRIRDAYLGWLRLASQGDMFAMATLPAVITVHPELEWPVQPEFWENWLIELLGEGEGAYALGAQYIMMRDYNENGTKYAEQKAGEFFLRSALAGHHAGMLGAEKTAIYRIHQPFTAPLFPEVTPIPPEFYGDDTTGEARYWLTRAANEGYWKACALLATNYAYPKKGDPDHKKAKLYYKISAKNGSSFSASLLGFAKMNNMLDKNFLKEISYNDYYIYTTLSYKLQNNGILFDDVKKGIILSANDIGIRQDKDIVSAGISEGNRIYNEWRTRYNSEQIQKAKLYAQARKRLPEVRAAYEQQKKSATPFRWKPE